MRNTVRGFGVGIHTGPTGRCRWVGRIPRAVALYPRNEDPFVGAPPWAIFVLSLRETARRRD